jgi:hypothetical protein
MLQSHIKLPRQVQLPMHASAFPYQTKQAVLKSRAEDAVVAGRPCSSTFPFLLTPLFPSYLIWISTVLIPTPLHTLTPMALPHLAHCAGTDHLHQAVHRVPQAVVLLLLIFLLLFLTRPSLHKILLLITATTILLALCSVQHRAGSSNTLEQGGLMKIPTNL